MLVKINESPASYQFEVRVGSDGQVALLEVNFLEVIAAVRAGDVRVDEEALRQVTPQAVGEVAKAARRVCGPPDVVGQLPDETLFSKVVEAGILFDAAGKEPGPSQT